jgi:hypothetical protein
MISVYQNKNLIVKKRFKKVDRKRGYFRGSKIGVKKGSKRGVYLMIPSVRRFKNRHFFSRLADKKPR